ncbi:MAG: Unknown protein, partial [uncultured Sulfurovum sp.]
AITHYEYNKQGEVVSIRNPLNGKTTLEYDTHGNLVKKRDANNNTTRYSYTREQALKSRSNALNQTSILNYDEKGRVKSYINPNHQSTQYFYDKLDRVTSTRDAINNELNYKYNNKAQLQAIIDPTKNQTQYSYDKQGRVEQEALPNSKVVEKVYNKDHTLKTIIREDKSEINFKYNEFKKPIEIEVQDTSATLSAGTSATLSASTPTQKLNFQYNEVGRLSSATSTASTGSATIELFYNRVGEVNKEVQFNSLVVEKTQNVKSSTKTLKFLELNITIKNDFKTQTKTITKNGKYPITIHYDKNGVETKTVYPNNLEEHYTFDANYNLINIKTGKTNLHYEYNVNGEITRKNSTAYKYDAIGRLTASTGSATVAATFHYDKAGNNLNNGAKYKKETNQLLENNHYFFTYDARGNLQTKTNKVNKEETSYTFNTLNQLI